MSNRDRSAVKYSWKSGFPNRGLDAQLIGAVLEDLGSATDGCLTPHQVVDHARDKDSALHPLFEWDDSVAAEAYRREQAGAMMRAIQIHYEVEPERFEVVRALQNVTRDSVRVYIPTIRALQDDDLRRQVIKSAYEELEGWTFRYRQYKELSEIIAEVDSLLTRGQLDDEKAASTTVTVAEAV